MNSYNTSTEHSLLRALGPGIIQTTSGVVSGLPRPDMIDYSHLIEISQVEYCSIQQPRDLEKTKAQDAPV